MTKCINGCILVGVTANGTCVSCKTRSCASWVGYNGIVRVTFCSNFLCVRILTNGTCVGLFTLLSTCWSGCNFFFVVVVTFVFWNDCVFVLNCIATINGTLLVLETCFVVSCFFIYNPNPNVTESVFDVICVTIGTSCTCVSCKALSCTCWLCYNCCVVVAESINCLLCNKCFSTYGAMFTFGKTCCCTVWCNGFVYCFGVACCGNYCLWNKNFVTYGAMFTFGKTCVCAVWCNGLVYYFGVACCWDCLSCDCCVTCCTNLVFGACVFASSLYINNPLALGVTCCWDCVLRNKCFSAYGAMFTFGKTCVCAVWCYCFVYYFGVTKC